MKIVIVSHSDSLGGAAVASLRLMEALRQAGEDARMLVTDKRLHDNPYIQVLGNPLANRWRFLYERLGIFLQNGLSRKTLFKIDDGATGADLLSHPWVKEADAVILNWINQGTLSLKGIARLAGTGKQVVWTMHDMWNCTGVCHHAFDCRRYIDICHDCPLTGKRGRDISTRTQEAKKALYDRLPLRFVAVSHWLAACCRNSLLMKNADITVIPNTFPASCYHFSRRHDSSICRETEGKTVMVMGAARLDDPVKGFDLLIQATRTLCTAFPETAARLHLLLYGHIVDESLLGRLALPYTYLGYAKDINLIMQNADIVLSPATFESFGLTLAEGMASGCIPVATGNDGRRDIVDHLQNGYIARSNSVDDFVRGILWAVNSGLKREDLHNVIVSKFDSAVIARAYLDLLQG